MPAGPLARWRHGDILLCGVAVPDAAQAQQSAKAAVNQISLRLPRADFELSVDLSLPAQGITALFGASGSGKTSLLRIICGLLEPSEGQASWCGQSISTLQEDLGRQMIYLGHAAALKDDLSPLENLQAASALGGQALSAVQARAALAAAGLRGFDSTPVRRLSQGQRRRSALARLVHGHYAALWVLDEPFNALDTGATAWLAELVKARVHGGGVVVLTSHQDVAVDVAQQQVLAL
ncbi:MAG: heme ABC exporter ATP-binding protein CcmA [Betaproteobacteria bacterium]|nr:heme ABC exporter ATP-binding protein CcmA [Betaproteobacteria bacterium]